MNNHYSKLVKFLSVAVLVVIGLAFKDESRAGLTTPSCINYNGPKDSSCRLNVVATDPENDNIFYTFNWGDDSLDTSTGYVASGTPKDAVHTWSTKSGVFTIYVTATDEGGNVSLQFQLAVKIFAGNLPNTPSSPTPAHNGFAPLDGEQDTGVTLSWRGGDPLDETTVSDSGNSVNYDIYLEDFGQDLQKIKTLSGQPFQDTQPVIYTVNSLDVSSLLTGGSFQRGQKYHWKIVATDGDGNIVTGPEWVFTVNSLPTILEQPEVLPDEPPNVNYNAQIKWTASDPDVGQSLSFKVMYGNSPYNMNPVNPDPLVNNGWIGTWITCALAENSNQTIKIQVSDGLETGLLSGESNLFTIKHTIVYNYPPDDFALVSNNSQKQFTISDGVVEIYPSSYIKFKGVCADKPSRNPAVSVNSGNQISYNGDLSYDQTTDPIDINGLEGNDINNLNFSLAQGAGLCPEVKYQVTYTKTRACGKPFIRTTTGNIYSKGDLKAQNPPTSSANTTYIVAAGGTTNSTRIISNFTSTRGYVKPDFGQLTFPRITNSVVPVKAAFDTWGLTHKSNGALVSDNDKNMYGHTVRVFNQDDIDSPINIVNKLNSVNGNPLDGQVYYFTGLTRPTRIAGMSIRAKIESSLTINNGSTSSNTKGSGLIIIDGDLEIAGNIVYDPASLDTLNLKVNNLASLGWIVLGNVKVLPLVTNIAGAFFVADNPYTSDFTEGIFNSGFTSSRLTILGPIIARKLEFVRITNGISESITNDGRIFINTPPGFSSVLKTLPTWQLRAP